jgi:XTP/dITP diphosphohydrolase
LGAGYDFLIFTYAGCLSGRLTEGLPKADSQDGMGRCRLANLLAVFFMRLYIATTNPGKLRDFAHAAEGHLLAGERIQIEPLPALAETPAPPEDEATFDANARIKALYYSRFAPGLLVVADDSGLEVNGLDNAPGVRSARYAEDQKFPSAPASTLDERNNAALLRAMDGFPEPCRKGR